MNTTSEWFAGVPQCWPVIPIKHGFRLIGSGTTPPTGEARFYDGTIPWVNTSELRENVVLQTDKTLTTEAIEEFTALKTYPVGTVLFAMYGATIGRVAILGVPATVNQAVCALADPSRFTPRFVFYGLQASREFLAACSTGGGQPNLNAEKVREHKLPCPDLQTQRAIADYLDRETARLDELVAAKERVLGLLAEKRRALITRAVTRGLDRRVPLRDSGIPWLGEIPAHWELCHLKRVLATIDYGISESVGPVGAVAVLRMGDIQDGEVEYSKLGFVDAVDQALLLRPGDLLFNRTNSLEQIGKVALFRRKADYPVSYASYLVRLRCGSRVLPEFLNWLLNSAFPVAWGRSEALPAIGQANLNPNRYGYLPMALPPLEEQKDIIAAIHGAIGKLDAVRAATERTIILLKERRAALIAAAVTGQIDAADFPAPVEFAPKERSC